MILLQAKKEISSEYIGLMHANELIAVTNPGYMQGAH